MEDVPSENSRLKTGGAVEALSSITEANEARLIGRRIGEYRIDSFIARGGMSLVYRAARVDGKFERSVAIKVSMMGALESGFRDRFLEEQRILARLSHPNISQLYDALITDEGWPCIVMELIEGKDIVAHCNDEALSVNDRIKLFRQIVDAIAAAHAQLIIHRDIKPSNVMVSEDGTPKLLDFGIAKQIRKTSTQTHHQLLSPRYASPEQLLNRPVSVTSDIYQLGLLMHEVLFGTPLLASEPYPDALQRAVQNRPVVIPEPQRKQLHRELALIIEQCLRASPAERYSDVGELRRDLEAFLAGYPVSAVGQSKLYRARKFIVRNQLTAGISALALTVLACSTLYYTLALREQRDEALRQTEIARESLSFLENFFSGADPDLTQGRGLTAKEVLVQGEARIEDELANQPAIQARLYYQLARIHYRLYDYDLAHRNVRKALAISEQESKLPANDRIDIENVHANILADLGEINRSREITRQLVERSIELNGPNAHLTLMLRSNLAISESDLGNEHEASRILLDNYQRLLAHHPDHMETVLSTALNLTSAYFRLGRLDESITLGTQSLGQAEEVLGKEHGITIQLLGMLGESLLRRDGLAAAKPYFAEQASRAATAFGAGSAPHSFALENIAIAEVIAGDATAWLSKLEQAIASTKERYGEDLGLWRSQTVLAHGLIRLERFVEAGSLLDEVLSKQQEALGRSNLDTFTTRTVRMKLLAAQGVPEAPELCRELMTQIASSYDTSHFLLDDLIKLSGTCDRLPLDQPR